MKKTGLKQLKGKVVKVTLNLRAEKEPIERYGETWIFNGIGFTGKFLSFSTIERRAIWTPSIGEVESIKLI